MTFVALWVNGDHSKRNRCALSKHRCDNHNLSSAYAGDCGSPFMLGITQGSQQRHGPVNSRSTMKTIKPVWFKPANTALLSLAIEASPHCWGTETQASNRSQCLRSN